MPPFSVPRSDRTSLAEAVVIPTEQAGWHKDGSVSFSLLLKAEPLSCPNPLWNRLPISRAFLPSGNSTADLYALGEDSQEPKTEEEAPKGPNFSSRGASEAHETQPYKQASTCYRKLTNRMLLQNSLSDFYFLKHCHCQSQSSGGRRQAAKEQLAVNYSLPNHLHLISGTGKTGTRPTSMGNGDGGAEQSLAARDISLLKPVGHIADITGFKTQTRSSNGPRFCTRCNPEPLWPESINQEERTGCKLSRHVNFPPESIPALS